MGQGSWGYTIDAVGDPLFGTADARLCTTSGVLKFNSTESPFVVANEFICGRLAMMMGLPAPPGVIVKLDDDRIGYLCIKFGPKGETPPPAFPDELAQDHPDLATGVVIFDCWIANGDRHEGNIAYARAHIPPMIFDHEKALLGARDGRKLRRLARVRKQAILNGCLAEHVKSAEPFPRYVGKARWLCENALPDICAEALRAGAVQESECKAVVAFLSDRASRLKDMLKALPIKGQMWLGT